MKKIEDKDERGLRDIEKTNPVPEYSHNDLSVNPKYFRDGYEYRWIRTDIRGVSDYRFESCMAEGWQVVPRDRVLGTDFQDPLGRNPHAKNFLCNKDTILMERPAHFGREEEERQRKKTESATNAVRTVVEDDNIFGRG